ncbi:hypothetical protein F4861DRAFT_546543 [Xylaria intraflava]|nr:hypothetical protein F4861DRAFT_546543 [Xylaria intraflava]
MLDMRPTQPPLVQPVWTLRCDHLQRKSHLHGYRERNWFPLCQDGLVNTSGYRIDHHYHEPLSQQFLHQTMDNQNLYPHGLDSGDEACPLNDYFAENFPLVGTGMQNVRGQTTAQSVSLTSCGRDQVGPSQPPYSNKAIPGNEQMFFPVYPPANAYTRDLTGSINQQQYQYHPTYNPNGLCNPSLDIEFQQRLPSSTEVYSSMSVFAEPFEYSHVSPATLNGSFTSSVGSSTASERMASMTLESVPPQGRPPAMDFRSDRHVITASVQGQSWVGGCPATISPKMLRINPSPTPMSSSESIQTCIPATGGDSDPGPSAWDQQQTRAILPEKRSNHKSRKELPTKPNKPRLVSSSPRESVSSRGKGKQHIQKHGHHSLRHRPDPVRETPAPQDHLAANVGDYLEAASSNSTDPERDAKNRFLVESKLAGMTYREIRRQGNFSEAESTLRGRFRTLTKNKEQRVRKPEWQDKDIRLLKKAVRKLSKGDGTTPGKVPWKQVAAYIYEHDGSYHFGNATCRKKWDELVEQGVAGLV